MAPTRTSRDDSVWYGIGTSALASGVVDNQEQGESLGDRLTFAMIAAIEATLEWTRSCIRKLTRNRQV